jgi:hypothetical protein
MMNVELVAFAFDSRGFFLFFFYDFSLLHIPLRLTFTVDVFTVHSKLATYQELDSRSALPLRQLSQWTIRSKNGTKAMVRASCLYDQLKILCLSHTFLSGQRILIMARRRWYERDNQLQPLNIDCIQPFPKHMSKWLLC